MRPASARQLRDQGSCSPAWRGIVGAQAAPEAAGLRSPRQANTVQLRIGQPERRRAQQAIERQIVAGIGHGRQAVEQIANLGPIEKAATGDSLIGDAGSLKGVFIGAKAAIAAAKDGNVAIAKLPCGCSNHLLQAVRQGMRCPFQGAVALGATGQVQLDVRAGERQAGERPHGIEGGKRLVPGFAGDLLFAHDGGQQAVEGGQQGLVGAMGTGQAAGKAVLADLAAGAAKHLHFGPAETVDRLLGVADDKEPPASAVEQLDQLALPLVGVLKLVDKQRFCLGPPACQHVGVVQEQVQCLLLKIVEVQRKALLLAHLVDRECAFETVPAARAAAAPSSWSSAISAWPTKGLRRRSYALRNALMRGLGSAGQLAALPLLPPAAERRRARQGRPR